LLPGHPAARSNKHSCCLYCPCSGNDQATSRKSREQQHRPKNENDRNRGNMKTAVSLTSPHICRVPSSFCRLYTYTHSLTHVPLNVPTQNEHIVRWSSHPSVLQHH
jgi:hypothetical protein